MLTVVIAAVLLVLSSALAATCLPWRISVLLTIIFVLVFDWFFIPPRGTFTVALHQHALMTLVVNLIVATPGSGVALWREHLFAGMSRNASGVVEFFRLPDNAVVELGTRVQI